MTATSAGWMVMPRVTINKALEMLSQDEILSLADATYRGTKDMFIFMEKRMMSNLSFNIENKSEKIWVPRKGTGKEWQNDLHNPT
jgi:hypothetical protein